MTSTLNPEALAALKNYTQADDDGVMVNVSRQALDEAIAALTSTQAPAQCVPNVSDIRWAINVLLEKIAGKFDAWETFDLFRSEAADTVRSFKHDLAAICPPFAWLIEKEFGSVLHYYAPTEPGEWTRDHLKACRFARKQDAEAIQFRHVARGHLPEGGTRVCEHGWMDHPAVTSTNSGRTTVWPTGTGNTPQDVQLASLVTRPNSNATETKGD